MVAPLFGSTLYRSVQFSWYESFYSYVEAKSEDHWLKSDIPHTGGL